MAPYIALNIATNAPFKNIEIHRKLSKLAGKFSSPYWVSTSTLRRLHVRVHPQHKKAGIIVDKGNIPYNVERMPSKHTLAQRIRNTDLLRRRKRKDLTMWYNISQTLDPRRLKDYVGKICPRNGLTGKRIKNPKVREALLTVGTKFTTNYWLTQDDSMALGLHTKPDINPVAVSYSAQQSRQSTSAVNRLKAGGIFLPSLSRECVRTTLLYNLDHFVDTKLVNHLRNIYPHKIFQGKKEFYAKNFSMSLLRKALECGYKSPFWYNSDVIQKRGLTVRKDEFFQFTSKQEPVKFYNQSVLSGSFFYERKLAFNAHFSLFHRLELPRTYFAALTKSVQVNKFTSNYWVTADEIRELGLKLRDGQTYTTLRAKLNESQAFLMYNIEQTVPLRLCT